jgi:predicted Zn-dependent protease
MSEGLGDWVEDVCGDLHQEKKPTSLGPFGILLLTAAFGVLLFGARGPTEDLLLELEEKREQTPEEVWIRRLQEALDEKPQGRYREAWTKLRALHKTSPREPRVNLELAVYHWEVGNRDFSDEYLRLVEAAHQEGTRGRMLRARLLLARGRDLHVEGTKPGRSPRHTLQLLTEARSAVEEARTRLPEGGSPEAPRPVVERLAAAIQVESETIAFKRAEALRRGGTETQKAEARKILQALLLRPKLDPKMRQRVEKAVGALREAPTEWRSAG